MSDPTIPHRHGHVFLGAGHETNERRTRAVIALCAVMMVAEIVGGALFGSIALVTDGLHMSTHAGALLLAALAYGYARRHAEDPRFSFGTGKLGDLAGFSSAIVLAMISLLIGYEALSRFFVPVPIDFAEAIPIACLGLAVNVASVWLLGGMHGHDHGHAHGHHHHAPGHDDESQTVDFGGATYRLEIFEDGVPPRFRLHATGSGQPPASATIVTERPGGARENFELTDRGDFLESAREIPEPHAFVARVRVGDDERAVRFAEHAHSHAMHRDNNMRAAVVHVLADAAVSVMVIVGLVLARLFGWLWMDPLASIIGAGVIASWSYGLIRDTGAVLLDMNPDRGVAENIRRAVEVDGDRVADLHLWRLGPGHLGAILSVVTFQPRGPGFYRARLARFAGLSHLTVEVERG
jgi:cation diffusion facilitator family transporter